MQACLSIPGSKAGAAFESFRDAQAAGRPFPWRFVAPRIDAAELRSVSSHSSAHPARTSSEIDCPVIEITCPRDRQLFAQAVEGGCDVARNLGATSIVIGFSSPHDAPLETMSLADLNRLAGEQGIAISVDVAAPRDVMRRRIDDIMALQDQRLGIAVDTGNYLVANPTSNVDVMLQRNIHQLQAVIVRDAPPSVSGNSDGEVLPLGGDGLIDYARVAQLLRDVSFAGPCIVDLSPNLSGSSDGMNWLTHPHFSDAVKHLEICGWFPRNRPTS